MDPSRKKLVAMFILQLASLIALFCTESINVEVIFNLNQNVLLLIQYLMLQKVEVDRSKEEFNCTIEFWDTLTLI